MKAIKIRDTRMIETKWVVIKNLFINLDNVVWIKFEGKTIKMKYKSDIEVVNFIDTKLELDLSSDEIERVKKFFYERFDYYMIV